MAKKSSGVKKLACDICGKKFGMPAHLGRHMATIHGATSKAAKKKAKKKAAKKTVAKKKAARKIGKKRPGRPPAIATRFGLSDLSLEDLAALIKAARKGFESKLREFKDLLA